MSLPIASIPVLTGDAAAHFEAEAQHAYLQYLHRTPEEEKAVADRYQRGIAMVKRMLAKSHLDE